MINNKDNVLKFCYLKHLPFNNKVKSAVGSKGKYWAVGSTINVYMMGGTTTQRKYFTDAISIYRSLNLGIKFNLNSNQADSDIRVSFVTNIGSWSYIGTDATFIDNSEATMNLGWTGLDVALHEIGHALGLLHEHQHPTSGIVWNESAVISDLSGEPNNWTISQIENNVLNTYNSTQVDTTTFDDQSIMLYYFPSEWVTNGIGVEKLNGVLSDGDKEFLLSKYPSQNTPEENCAINTYKEIFLLYQDVQRMNVRQCRKIAEQIGVVFFSTDKRPTMYNKLWAMFNS